MIEHVQILSCLGRWRVRRGRTMWTPLTQLSEWLVITPCERSMRGMKVKCNSLFDSFVTLLSGSVSCQPEPLTNRSLTPLHNNAYRTTRKPLRPIKREEERVQINLYVWPDLALFHWHGRASRVGSSLNDCGHWHAHILG